MFTRTVKLAVVALGLALVATCITGWEALAPVLALGWKSLVAVKAGGINVAFFGLVAPKARDMAKTKAMLNAIADPQSAGQPDATPWLMYSRKTYTDNTTTQLAFFDDVPTNKGNGNMGSAGSLPQPQYMEILAFGADLLRNPTAAAAAQVGAISDIQRLWFTSQAYWTFTMADKVWGPFPTSVLHPSGGVNGMGFGTTTADTGAIQWATNGPTDGGFPINGAIVVKPKVNFAVNVTWPTAIDLTGDIDIRFWIWAILYRKVL